MLTPPAHSVRLAPSAVVSCLVALAASVLAAFGAPRAHFSLHIGHIENPSGTVTADVLLDPCGMVPNGAGVAIAFDSRVLAFDHVDVVLASDLLAVSEATEPDEHDIDRNSDTDRLVRIAWLAPLGDWPGNAAPTTVARIALRTVTPDADEPIEDSITLTPLGRGVGRLIPPVRRTLSSEREALPEPVWPQRVTEATLAAVEEVSARSWSEATETFPTSCTLDVDGNASFDALTDGILIMRYLFGFSGFTLTTGAVGTGAMRSDATAIAEFLADSSCAAMLDADGNGTKDALTDGILIARYLFGFSGTTLTANALGSGATRTDGATVGSFLAVFASSSPALMLQAPWLEAPLISQIPATLRVATVYTGAGKLTYALANGPTGMTIDTATGALSWTPSAAMEGQQPSVRVTATDGTLSAEVTFTVRVANGTQVTTAVSGSTVTVTQSGTLQGLAMTLPAQTSIPAPELKIFTIPVAQAPPLPEGVARVSDFFRTTPVQATGGDITVSMPTAGLPGGVSAERLRLYVYGTANVKPDIGGATDEPAWLSSSFGLTVLPSGAVTIRADRLGRLSFLGYGAGGATLLAGGGSSRSLDGTSPGGATDRTATRCMPQLLANGALSLHSTVCQATEDRSAAAVTFTIRNFLDHQWNPPATQENLVEWLTAANTKFTSLGLSSDPTLDVVVEDLPKPSWLGYVSIDNGENRRVLHLTRAMRRKADMQCTAAHEYFHHAQSRTTATGMTNLIDTTADWLIEGTANWFEDEVFDELDSFRTATITKPVPRVLERGLDAQFDTTHPETSPYDKMMFWKTVHGSCNAFKLSQLLNVDTSTDPTGIANLKAKLESEAWQCDFGHGFGEANARTLAAAMLYYTWATVLESNLTLLDLNESAFRFEKTTKRLTPSAACTSFEACPSTASIDTTLLAAAAESFLVEAVPAPQAGQSVTIEIKSASAGKELWIWIGEATAGKGITNGTWYKTTGTISHTSIPGEPVPAKEVILVNPDVERTVDYKVRVGLTQSSGVTITFSQSGYTNESDLCPWCGQWPYSNTYGWDYTLAGSVSAPCQGGTFIDDDPWNGPTSVDVDLWGCPATGEVTFQGTYVLTARFPLVGSVSNGSETYSWIHTNLQQILENREGTQQFTSPFTCRAPLPDQSWNHSGWLCSGFVKMDRWRSFTGSWDEFGVGHFSVSFDITSTPRTASPAEQP